MHTVLKIASCFVCRQPFCNPRSCPLSILACFSTSTGLPYSPHHWGRGLSVWLRYHWPSKILLIIYACILYWTFTLFSYIQHISIHILYDVCDCSALAILNPPCSVICTHTYCCNLYIHAWALISQHAGLDTHVLPQGDNWWGAKFFTISPSHSMSLAVMASVHTWTDDDVLSALNFLQMCIQ